MKTNRNRIIATSFAILATFILADVSFAQVTAELKNVSFGAVATPSGRVIMKVSGGNGTVKNEKNVIVAQGALKSVDQVMTVVAIKSATFVHTPAKGAFPADTFSSSPIEEFATVELSEGSQWTIKDDKFAFIVEIPDMTQPRAVVALDKSLGRASAITLPKGTHSLWGYTITVEKSTGTVKFAHGKIVAASNATYK